MLEECRGNWVLCRLLIRNNTCWLLKIISVRIFSLLNNLEEKKNFHFSSYNGYRDSIYVTKHLVLIWHDCISNSFYDVHTFSSDNIRLGLI